MIFTNIAQRVGGLTRVGSYPPSARVGCYPPLTRVGGHPAPTTFLSFSFIIFSFFFLFGGVYRYLGEGVVW